MIKVVLTFAFVIALIYTLYKGCQWWLDRRVKLNKELEELDVKEQELELREKVATKRSKVKKTETVINKLEKRV